jgi:SAM-dependent methyltransferase
MADEPIQDIRSFWDARAVDPALDPKQVTHPDIWQRWLEIETVKRLISKRDRVIDIGCGAGYASSQIAPHVAELLGVDYSAKMIERARIDNAPLPKNLNFDVVDVLELRPDRYDVFDVALTIRCLINLPTWEMQKIALRNIASVVKPGGLYIFLEGLRDGRDGLNRLRQSVGLSAMPTVWHNRDFERAATLEFLSSFFSLEHEIGFGTYDLIARVVHPLMVAPEEPTYDARINEIAAQLALQRPKDLENSRTAIFSLRRL